MLELVDSSRHLFDVAKSFITIPTAMGSSIERIKAQMQD
jgi:hypothetical protein